MSRLDIRTEDDISRARTGARALAAELGFSMIDKTRIATAVSELARNTLIHGGGGYMEVEAAGDGDRVGIRCVFVDQGAGIPDIDQAMTDGFSTGNYLGQGLPGSKRLMDQFMIESQAEQGTRVEMVKWA